ncbi:MAG: crotonase/enoyl-CoA hydratase family protein [Jatrophihabitans sp.]
MAAQRKGLRKRVHKVRNQARAARAMANLAKDDPQILVDLGKGLLAKRGLIADPNATSPDMLPTGATDGAARTAPVALREFARTTSADVETSAAPDAVLAAALDVARWPDWFTMHNDWSVEPPATIEVGVTFSEHIKIMGIPAELNWTVVEVGATSLRMNGTGRVGVHMSLFVDVRSTPTGSHVWIDLGLDGDSVRGPMGATVQRAVQGVLTESAEALAATLDGAPRRGANTPILHERTGTMLDPRTPVIVGAGQFVQREPSAPFEDPVSLSVRALRAAAQDSTVPELLARADAVYAVASASWTYGDQAALVAQQVGAKPKETVVSAPFGGDGAQLTINAAAQAIATGAAEIVLVTGAEAGASLSVATKQDITPDWPQQPDGTAPTRTLGLDKEANNDAEAAANLGTPILMYALLESAVRAKAGEDAETHQKRITELWSRFSAVAADNPYAWLRQNFSGEELANPTTANRMISSPYPKLLCANLTVDLATGLILCSAAAAQAAGVPQDKWVFVHAGASAHDEWFVSERADLASSPAIHAIGAAASRHAGVQVSDIAHVDLYSCFPAAVQIAATELGLPIDDPQRPLTVTGGLTFAGGPGNNYGAHAVATLVGRLRADPDAFGLSTSLGWFVTKHAIGIYSARPPVRPYANLHPVVDLPAGRRALADYTGPGVVEAYTLPYGRDGQPDSAILSVITPDGARALVRTKDPQLIELIATSDPLRRKIIITGPGAFELGANRRAKLPPPPEAPVLVERRGEITVITLNRPEVRNAIDRRTALLLERAIDGFEADSDATVAILTGAGGYFCAGADLKAAARGDGYPFSEHRGLLGLPGKPAIKPVIAAVEGPALAGGCELALAADMIVASSDSIFGIPEVKRGLVAAAGGVLRLAQRLPRAVALELALTGDPMTAQRMADLGLINAVVEPGQALAAALELAGRIAVNAPLSVAISKRIVDESPDWTVDGAYDRQTELATPILTSADATEGVRAFAEHRAPKWAGR